MLTQLDVCLPPYCCESVMLEVAGGWEGLASGIGDSAADANGKLFW